MSRRRLVALALMAVAVGAFTSCSDHGSKAASPPGSLRDAPSSSLAPSPAVTEVSTTSATAKRCTTEPLTISYRDFGMGTGNAFGEIAIFAKGSPCRLDGAATLQALDGRRRPVGDLLGPAMVPPGLVLGIPASPPSAGAYYRPPSGLIYAAVVLEGAFRDDPRTGELCAAANRVTPAYWRLSLDGRVWTVPNYDLGSPGWKPDSPSLTACRAAFGIIAVRAEP